MKKIIIITSVLAAAFTTSAQNVGIGTNAPTEKLHVVGGGRYTSLSGVGTRMVVANANGVLGVQAIPAAGDITGVTAGAGLTGGGTVGNVTLTAAADNGLYVNAAADRIRLGGPLVENTVVSLAGFNMDFNLNGLGDFAVQDGGIDHFHISSTGLSYFGDNTYWRDGNALTGTLFAQIYDDADDGHMVLYENGGAQIRLDANGTSIFNEQGFDRDFRIESDGRTHALWVDASTNIVNFGDVTATATGDGTTVAGSVVDYVADFDLGGANWDGTAVGIGSIEYFLDGVATTMINNSFGPTTHILEDLGTNTRAWDDVYADDYWLISDVTKKQNIVEMKYGLKEVLAFETISYTLKDDRFQTPKIGLKAQQALTLVPESVKEYDHKILDETNPGEYTRVKNDHLSMSYQSLVPVLIKATQEQQEIIEAQNDKIDQLQQEIDEIKRLLQK